MMTSCHSEAERSEGEESQILQSHYSFRMTEYLREY